MKILHVTSDWKWTGPAAPMLDLLRAQRYRGHEVDLSCPEPEPGARSSLADRARAVGVNPIMELSRARGVSWLRDREDFRRLQEVVSDEKFEIVHTWHTRDHVLAIRALAERRRVGATRLIRSYRNAEVISAWPWHRWLFGPGTDGLLCVSPKSADWNRRLRGGRAVLGSFGAVDLEVFKPRSPDPLARRALGLRQEDRVIAVVARIQRHRRFDLLLEAMRRLATHDKDVRLLILGRGTHRDEVARDPVKQLGISDRVIFAGYRRKDYVDTLCVADCLTFLIPGSDGTCRALLEAAACGVPAVVSRRGALPEIVVDGETGLVVDENPEALCDAWQRLLGNSSMRSAMGAAARRRAEIHFAPTRWAAQVEELYRAR